MIDYDFAAADYAKHRRVHPEVLRCLVSRLTSTAKVVEVGCGTGNYLTALREQVRCACWGVDPSAAMLAHVRERLNDVHVHQGRAEDLQLPAGEFDLLFSVDVIHHVKDHRRFFREAWSVLRAGARICTVTDSEWIIRHRQPLAVYFPETVTIDLTRYPRVQDVTSSLQEAGFTEIVEETVEFAYTLSDIGPFRAKAFSCLQFIPEAVFRQGIEQMERDLSAGPIPCVSRYLLVWGTKPSPAA